MHYSNLPRDLDKRTTITIGDQTTTVEASDLQKICDLGRGAYGIVEKMRHIPSDTIMAVKVSGLKLVPSCISNLNVECSMDLMSMTIVCTRG